MKLLPAAPPTLEDSDIWLSIVVGYGLDWATVGVIFRDADRRDAELMRDLMKPATSQWCYGCPAGPMACPVRCQRQVWSGGFLWLGAEINLTY